MKKNLNFIALSFIAIFLCLMGIFTISGMGKLFYDKNAKISENSVSAANYTLKVAGPRLYASTSAPSSNRISVKDISSSDQEKVYINRPSMYLYSDNSDDEIVYSLPRNQSLNSTYDYYPIALSFYLSSSSVVKFAGWYENNSDYGWTKISSETYWRMSQTDVNNYSNSASFDEEIIITPLFYSVASGVTLTFDKQGGSGGTTSKRVSYGMSMSSITCPTKTGHTFLGYNSRADGRGDDYFSSSGAALKVAPPSMTLYAQWRAQTCSVSAYTNGGTLVSANGWNQIASSITKNIAYGNPLGSFPIVSRTGYVLKGWFTEASGGTEVTVSTTFGLETLAYIYAQWEKGSYAVTANVNGGKLGSNLNGWTKNGDNAKKNITYLTNYGNFPQVTRDGFHLKGWYFASSGGTEVTSSTVMDKGAAHSIYAQWLQNEYTVVFDFNGGLNSYNSSSSSTKLKFEQGYSFPIPKKEGFTLTGWRCSFNNIIYPTNSSDQSLYLSMPNLGSNGVNATFFAQWRANSYSVCFNGNGGKGSMPNQSFIYKNSSEQGNALSSNNFTKVGYSFVGWNTDLSAKEPLYYDKQIVKNLTSKEGEIINLYAIWGINHYKLKLDAKGGSFPINMNGWEIENGLAVKDIEYNSAFGYLPKPTKRGQIFLGWFDVNGLIAGENMIIKAEDVTLTAEWQDSWAHLSNIQQPKNEGGIYLISNAQELAWLASECEINNSRFQVKQTANIDLSDNIWKPIGSEDFAFKGCFDGQGFKIEGMKVINGYYDNCQGLFGNVEGEKIDKPVIIKNVRLFGKVSGNEEVAAIVGRAENAVIKGSSAFVEIQASAKVGGVVGRAKDNVYVENCYCYGSISATGDKVGGLIGEVSGINFEMKNCMSKMSLISSNHCGGLIGYAAQNFKLSACCFEGNMEVASGNRGLFVGYSVLSGTIENCFSKLLNNADGLAGQYYGEATVLNCLFEFDGVKKYVGEDFSQWIMLEDGMPLPRALIWRGSTEVEFNLSESGFSKA